MNYADVAAWDRKRRRELGFLAGLKWFERLPNGRIMLVSRHWPHRLCWSWFIDLSRIRTDLGYPRKFGFVASRLARQVRVALWSHELAFHWQHSWWMANVGPESMTAPRPIWRRQFLNPDLPDADQGSQGRRR